MAQECPPTKDIQDIQFKLHDKFTIFDANGSLRSRVNLLAAANGFIFAGNPNAPELKVAIAKELLNVKQTGSPLHMRTVPLPGVPNSIACSADGTMLAVQYTAQNSAFLQIYSVATFTTTSIKSLYSLSLSPDENVTASQLLWNPVITTSVAVVLSNGALVLYTLKENGQFEMHTLNKAQQVKCGCWSPKGKQIVLGFENGRLQQFKPDLTPAKTIACPGGILPGPFDTIALQWLSTYQFAAAFLQHGEESALSLFIINAPKAGAPTYINYYDVCYSACGPREQQISFTHIPQWNLLLVVSANGVEIGLLGTKDGTETPTWVQYNLLDEARIEMPLTDAKDETFPIGFTFDVSSMLQLTIGEKKMPIMPMVYVLSTHGHLLSFTFLNLTPGAVDVCSPPPPITDTSGQFLPLQVQNDLPPETKQQGSELSFGFNTNTITSTPANVKASPAQFGSPAVNTNTVFSGPPQTFGQAAPLTFGAPAPQPFSPVTSLSIPTTTAALPSLQFSANSFGATTAAPFSGLAVKPKELTLATATSTTNTFGNAAKTITPFSGFGAKPKEPSPTVSTTEPQQQTLATSGVSQNNDINKPLYTVSPMFNAPSSGTPVATSEQPQATANQPIAPIEPQIEPSESDDIVKQMIALQINSFDAELKQLAGQTKRLLVNVGDFAEMKQNTKRLNDLHEIIQQADDRDFEIDVQNLRYALNESYAMLTECRSKLEMYQNPEITQLTNISSFDPINRRQLSKLQNLLAVNQVDMQQLQQQIDQQWSNYQDTLRRTSNKQMHIPCLYGIYQRMNKLKDLIGNQRVKLNFIKSKLKQRGLIYKPQDELAASSSLTSINSDTICESLTDSMLSMSLSHIVDANRSKLSPEKLNAIRNYTLQRQHITIIKPQRPNRVGLKSEVILETKLRGERKAREGATANLSKMQQQDKLLPKSTIGSGPELTMSAQLAKPTATKPTVTAMQTPIAFAGPTQATTTAPSFNFAGKSLFVKTSSVSAATKTEDASKLFSMPTSTSGNTFVTSGTFSSPSFSIGSAPVNFGQTKTTAPKPESLKEALTAPPAVQAPISFSAKVIGGNDPSKSAYLGGVATSLPLPTVDAKLKLSFASEQKKNEETPKMFGFAGITSEASATTNADSFGSALKSSINSSGTPTANVKPTLFTGFGQSIGNTVTTSSSAPINFSFSSAAAAADFNTLTTATTPSSQAVTLTSTATPVSSTTDDATNKLLEAVKICKPTTKSAAEPAKIFGGFGSANIAAAFSSAKTASNEAEPSKQLFNAANTTVPSTELSFAAAANNMVKATATSTPTTAATEAPSSTPSTPQTGTETTSIPLNLAASAVEGSSTATSKASSIAITAPTTSTVSTAQPSATVASSIPSGLFGSVAPAVVATSAPAASTGSTSATTPPWGGAGLFGKPSAAGTATSIFGGTATANAAPNAITPSIFSTAAKETAPIAAPVTTPGSIFGSASTAPSIFGGIPKPDQSLFSSPPAPTQPAVSEGSNLFGGGSDALKSLSFGSPASPGAASGGNIFGGGATASSPPPFGSGGSIFGGGTATTTSPFGSPNAANNAGSIFGGANKTVFGSPNPTNSGGSLFGGNAFGQTPQQSQSGSIFGSTSTQQTTNAPTFGTGGSIFGGSAMNNSATSGGSIFGGSAPVAAPAFGSPAPAVASSGFGSFAQANTGSAFGAASTGGSFAQGGASVAQSGFGSPQQSSAFNKPLFGGTAAFGSPPTFGAQPSFGGAAMFGSPKGFGTFGAGASPTAPGTAFGSPPQKNNLFEALGSTNSGISFGNLAQNTNPNGQKPAFGGSSFMNYRA